MSANVTSRNLPPKAAICPKCGVDHAARRAARIAAALAASRRGALL